MYSDQMEAEQAFSSVLNSHKCGTSSGVARFGGGAGGGETLPFSHKNKGKKESN